MTFGSLFAGIGGFDLGLERAGMQCKWQVEIDPYCTRVLKKHWPHVRRYGDIRTVTDVERVDLLCGGFPCQDISNAGLRAGIDGEHSGLWSEYVRIIRLVRPRYVLVENVAALLGRGMGRVLGDLSACGYDAEWDVIPASAVGAKHIRERVWIVAYASAFRGTPGLADTSRREEGFAGIIDYCGPDLAHSERFSGSLRSASKRQQGGSSGSSDNLANSYFKPKIWTSKPWEECASWAVEPDVGRVAHGVPARVDRLKGLGNAVVPQVVEWIGRRIIEYDGGMNA